MALADYIVEQTGLDWSDLLRPWHRVLPGEFTLWMVNRFADLFIVREDDTVWTLRMDEGHLEPVAATRDDFAALADDEAFARERFLIPLVDQQRAARIQIGAGECYGFIQPPVIGGDYVISNVRVRKLDDYYRSCANHRPALVANLHLPWTHTHTLPNRRASSRLRTSRFRAACGSKRATFSTTQVTRCSHEPLKT
jgi:hypothetical protein